MKVAIIGSRDFNDYNYMCEMMDDFTKCHFTITTIISGGAKGADSLGEKWAEDNNLPTEIYKPDWKKYGRSAGYIRNADIVDNSQHVIAFWDGNSKGTLNSVDRAKKNKIAVTIYEYENTGKNKRTI